MVEVWGGGVKGFFLGGYGVRVEAGIHPRPRPPSFASLTPWRGWMPEGVEGGADRGEYHGVGGVREAPRVGEGGADASDGVGGGVVRVEGPEGAGEGPGVPGVGGGSRCR